MPHLPSELLLLIFARLPPSTLISVLPLVSRQWGLLARTVVSGGLHSGDSGDARARESEEDPVVPNGMRGAMLTVEVELVLSPKLVREDQRGQPWDNIVWVAKRKLYSRLKNVPHPSPSSSSKPPTTPPRPAIGFVRLQSPSNALTHASDLSSAVGTLAPVAFDLPPGPIPTFVPVLTTLNFIGIVQDPLIAHEALNVFTTQCVSATYALVQMWAHPFPETGAGAAGGGTGIAAIAPPRVPTPHTTPTHIDLVVHRRQPNESILADLASVFPNVRDLRVGIPNASGCTRLFPDQFAVPPLPAQPYPGVTSFTVTTGIGTFTSVSFLTLLSAIFATFPNLFTLGALDFFDGMWPFLPLNLTHVPDHPQFPKLRTLVLNLGAWGFSERNEVPVGFSTSLIPAFVDTLHALFPQLDILELILVGARAVRSSGMFTASVAGEWARAVAGKGLRRVVLVGWPSGDGSRDGSGEWARKEPSEKQEEERELVQFTVELKRECKEVGVKVVVDEGGH
ncbi:hypothetical protein M427DRAFT_59829 [Gonapodya prolifera JEL478]|uniref:F-box domain-containing protein n=1 Tax=Gonapodya prolifera (strain JEL478) TaxID=1344416 RepID=A0A139A5S3_GONPJ|nr:hypothetical protein M427DRAFT_59829 [Gonapodya prolifera JEL478]|eukprot:KXS12150.1 hypothetical protein M427DRAFT_59829 [Gonapodya prolifera JEL478]